MIVYEMLTGEAPFSGRDAGEIVLSVLRTTPEPPSARNAAVPRYYDAVVGRMIAKSLHGRYGSAAAAAAELRDLAERKDPPEPARTPAGAPAEGRSWIGPAALGVVLAAAALALWLWGGG